MGTVTITAPARVTRCETTLVAAVAGAVDVMDTGTINTWTTGPRDQLVVREFHPSQRQAAKAELRSAVIGRMTEVLDGVGELTFSVPADDPCLADAFGYGDAWADGPREAQLLGNEVEWWRDGAIRFAGPVVAAEVDAAAGVVEFTAFSLEWYLSKRVMGAPQRRDLLVGAGSFDRFGLRGWTSSGGAVLSRETGDKVRGSGAMKISGGGAATYTVRFPATEAGQDTTVRLTAMVKPAAGTPVGSRLLSISATPVGDTDAWRPLPDNDVNVGEDTALGEWDRYSAYCLLKPGVDNNITVVLWAPVSAAIKFDDVRVLRNDTTGIPASEPDARRDLTRHAVALVNHVQTAYGKGQGYRLKTKVLSPSGTSEVMAVRHVEHSSVLDLLDALASRDDGIDWWVNPQTRTFCVAARRGSDKPDVPLSDRTVMAGGWTQDDSDTVGEVMVLGDENGPERPEGYGSSGQRAALYGLGADYVHRAPVGTRLSQLDSMAQGLANTKGLPSVTLRPVRVPESWWAGYDLTPGDRLPQHYRVGVLRPPSPDGWVRVSRLDHYPSDGMIEVS